MMSELIGAAAHDDDDVLLLLWLVVGGGWRSVGGNSEFCEFRA